MHRKPIEVFRACLVFRQARSESECIAVAFGQQKVSALRRGALIELFRCLTCSPRLTRIVWTSDPLVRECPRNSRLSEWSPLTEASIFVCSHQECGVANRESEIALLWRALRLDRIWFRI